MAERITVQMRSSRTARRRRLGGVIGAVVAGALPAVVSAAEGGRALEQPENFGTMLLVTAGAALGLLFLASLGRMYQRQRGIRWRFQDPDQPHDSH